MMPIIGLLTKFRLWLAARLPMSCLILLMLTSWVLVICLIRTVVHLGSTRGLSLEEEVAVVLVGIRPMLMFLCLVTVLWCLLTAPRHLLLERFPPVLSDVVVLHLLLVVDGWGRKHPLTVLLLVLEKDRLTRDDLMTRFLEPATTELPVRLGNFRVLTLATNVAHMTMVSA